MFYSIDSIVRTRGRARCSSLKLRRGASNLEKVQIENVTVPVFIDQDRLMACSA